jgi:predicted PurR-regulated permease PerM
VVFLGVLGGLLAFGVIGVFLGPTLLAVGYRLATEWTAGGQSATAQGDSNAEHMN